MQGVLASGNAATRAPRRQRSQYAVNWDVYHSPGIDRCYTATTLTPAETVVLLKHQPHVADRAVLDIGVGTGRTAAFLKPLARRYACLDYSPAMVDRVRRDHPDADVRLMDMCDLTPWPAGAFDFVFATSNVLDAVCHADRLQVLAQVRRVLAPGGLFAFSSHNRRYHLAGRGPRLECSRNPVTQLLLAGRFLRCWANHRRLQPSRELGEEYALLDDPGHDFALLHYYITRDCQALQLAAAGFQLLDVVDGRGHALTGDDDDAGSPSLMYVARQR